MWNFCYAPIFAEAPEHFYEEGYDASAWDTLPVPGNWQMYGYGTPMYSSSKYPFPIDPPYVPLETPTGCYIRDFHVPAAWQGRQLFLTFEGVDSAFHVWVNGIEAGYSQGSHLHSEFNVTKLLRQGDNRIAVQVYQWSDGSYLEDQDKWRLSGIFRDVCLTAVPDVDVRDVSVRTELDEDARDAVLKAAVELVFAANSMSESGIRTFRKLRAELLDPELATVYEDSSGWNSHRAR